MNLQRTYDFCAGKLYLLINLFHNYLLDKGIQEDHSVFESRANEA